MTTPTSNSQLTATHWGTYLVETENGCLKAVEPWAGDPDPSPIGQSFVGAVDGPLRVSRPSFRREWLEHKGSRAAGRRGADPFVELEWDEALDLVAGELQRVCDEHGNGAIYGGSYGWASAGRFHHAQGQLHRFLNTIGGYTGSVNSYSYAAGEVLLPHIIGSMNGLTGSHSTWDGIANEGRLVVCFGGIPKRNAQVQAGGLGRHEVLSAMKNARASGVRFVNISPVRDDGPEGVESEWVPLRPNTDTAMMLAIAHTLLTEELHDVDFLQRYCVGFEKLRAYILGETDGAAKTPGWAAAICGVEPDFIRALARDMAAVRTMIMVNWAIQRADHGEQPYWMTVALAAMLGQIGLPGGGFGFGYSSTNGAGRAELGFKWPSLPQGNNPIGQVIPVARLADMLESPGKAFEFDGRTLTYPDIRLVYWAGGNPFHPHQDLNRLAEAWQRPETVIVHEPYWTATARHADIVLPVTTTLEREDLAFANRENLALAMKQIIKPVGQARDDFSIFRSLAMRFQREQDFTGGRDAAGWIRTLYNEAKQRAAVGDVTLPDFDTFWALGHFEAERKISTSTLFLDFRNDPQKYPLRTPSGLIELFSETIDAFGYDDCPGHPVWREPQEWLGSPSARQFPLHLLSPQPADKLHSQLDQGSVSLAAKVSGRARLLLHRQDADARGIKEGDVVRVFNDRGACLAGAVLTEAVLPGVVQIPTGAWYDPSDPKTSGSLEKHGNPNVLTPDRGTSRLAQGSSCNSTLVDVSLYQDEPPDVTIRRPPPIVPPQCKLDD
ncbi:molybdopterin guanine dinucleotide-containing S/N-oxide reductase (plasmid) [Agrobacterium tumefaciens]|uniref:molybdopterin guanine dinucleotide-containing S/N-oxide reductase n=1 Tax=Agrobacterium tumefaciens TaxID=358 RepID=UPI001571E347|nr:molybdopterin guanine dinucleotide-containing S/N-oxide reductase [Agrobacterium tumefaciens]NSZ66582.1 molybdopterin-dependent oxidoreductase [Agrobacterium tumefaciens]NTA72954.1 molybdopterin-dependent oxidoreductase [Agrobacterium tumefaciens]WIE41502.1 molybdopterin guanine dinucleotide-containing S/N-oxide reductase [Agrobacterium tumefaciens]